MMAGEILTDRELREQLIRHGLNPGPIVPTTRKLYEKKLMQVLLRSSEGNSAATASSRIIIAGTGSGRDIPGVIRAAETASVNHQLNGNGLNGHDNQTVNGHNDDVEFVPPTQHHQQPQQPNATFLNGSSINQQSQQGGLYSQARQDLSNMGRSVLDAGPSSLTAANAGSDDDDFTPQTGFIAARVPSQQPTLLGRTAEFGGGGSQRTHASQQPQQTPSHSRATAGPPPSQSQSSSYNRGAALGTQFSSSSTASTSSAAVLRDLNYVPSPFGRRPIKGRTMHDTFGNSFYLDSDSNNNNESALNRRPQQTGREELKSTSTVDGRKGAMAAEHRSAFGPIMKLVLVCFLGLLLAAAFYMYRTGMYEPYFDKMRNVNGQIDADNDPITKLKERIMHKHDDSGNPYLPGA